MTMPRKPIDVWHRLPAGQFVAPASSRWWQVDNMLGRAGFSRAFRTPKLGKADRSPHRQDAGATGMPAPQDTKVGGRRWSTQADLRQARPSRNSRINRKDCAHDFAFCDLWVLVFGGITIGASDSNAQDATPLAGLVLPADKGKSTYHTNEELAGTSEFRWSADGSFENKATILRAGGERPPLCVLSWTMPVCGPRWP